MNLAIDSNLLVSAILLPHSLPGTVLAAWRAGAFTWVCCDDQWNELTLTLARPHLLGRIAQGTVPVQALLQDMRASCRWVKLSKPLPSICRDAYDDFLFALYNDGHVSLIVSGDKDVLALKDTYPVLTVRELIERL